MTRQERRAFGGVLLALTGLLFALAYLAVHVGRLEHRDRPAPATTARTVPPAVCDPKTGYLVWLGDDGHVTVAPGPQCPRETP